MGEGNPLLLVGEIIVDFTTAKPGVECKLRLGGVVHAARGLWACDLPYAVAAVCPSYLVDQARDFLTVHGCKDFVWLGEIIGSPNVMVIGDATEVSDQGYEDLLRDEKSVKFFDVGTALSAYSEVLIFPGRYSLAEIKRFVATDARFSFDIAYDVDDFSLLDAFSGHLSAVITSTSSPLFARIGSEDITPMLDAVKSLGAEVFLLKENRGGSRMFNLGAGKTELIPAILSTTINSVGVGDVYSAVMLGFRHKGWEDAAWRGARAATAYSQTTYPDDFRRDVKRELKLSLDELRDLGGTNLPWHDRPRFHIYLAAPDFTYVHKPEVDRAVEALRYHNFRLRRPVQENGELPLGSSDAVLHQTFAADVALLEKCDVVFAIPLERDPGTLVELGMALARNKPVIAFDPRRENNNTMVTGGSASYSDDLDASLNALFVTISKLWMGTP
ncbi:sugar kinase [Rhizobium chutanense]|uniref:Sugar kinase n=1 Tax=Rhizobium chutanense TaxID=2035448 RepID=A0A2A6J4F9_9HYPH|nr:nucleoside 2-deoxyribosyltransferase [Rhizobium chutanense]PDT00774.1 sugar kinase [Rhizobium chutanense]